MVCFELHNKNANHKAKRPRCPRRRRHDRARDRLRIYAVRPHQPAEKRHGACGLARTWADRRQRTETTPAPCVHASQGEGDTVFAHAHRRVHETNFRNCGAVGLQSRLGADNPRGVPQMAWRESRERLASGAARDYRLKRFELKTENRSRNNGSGQRFIASNGDSRHPTAEFRFIQAQYYEKITNLNATRKGVSS